MDQPMKFRKTSRSRYVMPSSEVKTSFLKCVKVPDCKAIALHKATKDMEGYDIPDKKLVVLVQMARP